MLQFCNFINVINSLKKWRTMSFLGNFCVIHESSLTALLIWEEGEIKSTHLRCSVKIKTLTQVLCCEYCKIFKKTYFKEQLQTVASEKCYPNKTIVLIVITFGSFINALKGYVVLSVLLTWYSLFGIVSWALLMFEN